MLKKSALIQELDLRRTWDKAEHIFLTSFGVFGFLMVKPGPLVTNVTIWLLEPFKNIIEGWVDAFDWIRNHTCATLQEISYMLSY